MLLRFRAANVLSFRGEFELSLLPPRGVEHARAVGVRAEGRELTVLPLVAIFGANASGKSNVLHAMRWMVQAVTQSVAGWLNEPGIPRPVFALDPAARDETSLFEVDVVIDGVRYVYGFEVSDARVETEWLHAYPGRHKQVWFERDAEIEEPYRFPSDWLKGNRRELVTLTRPNALFLTVAAQFNHPQLSPVRRWFVDNLWPFTPRGLLTTKRHLVRLADPGFRTRFTELLRAADLGIAGLEDVTDEDGRLSTQILHHGRGGEVPLAFDQESLGTRAWYGFLGAMIATLDAGTVLLVDELDSSLHPMLVAEVLRLFRDRDANPHGAQLICTVHDVTLLGSAHAERPLSPHEVWITEKKQSTGESELYPLTDAHPRVGESLERGYLRGRYGGVPNLATNALALELVRAAEAGG